MRLKIPIIIIVTFVVLQLSCGQTNPNALKTGANIETSEGKDFFSDIDYYNLTGIDPIREISYPCIQIRDSSKQKIVTFFINKQHSFEKRYSKNGDIWISFYSYKGDTSTIYSYEFVFKDRIVELNYSDTLNRRVLDVSLIKGNEKITWIPQHELKFSPDPRNLDIVKNNFTSRQLETFQKENSVMLRTVKNETSDGQTIRRYQECYPSNSKSIFWWFHFGSFQKQMATCL